MPSKTFGYTRTVTAYILPRPNFGMLNERVWFKFIVVWIVLYEINNNGRRTILLQWSNQKNIIKIRGRGQLSICGLDHYIWFSALRILAIATAGINQCTACE